MDEIWRDIPGYEGLYQVSDLGRVRCIAARDGKGRRKDIGKLMAPDHQRNGYVQVGLTKQRKRTKKYVHRLVLEAFVGPCQSGQQGNHINGVKDDNRLLNLEYVTSSANHFHAYQVLGKQAARGSAKKGTKLAEADVRRVRELHKAGMAGREIAKQFHVSESTVSAIVLNKRWSHIH